MRFVKTQRIEPKPLTGPVEYEITCAHCGKTFRIAKMSELEFESGLSRMTCPGTGHAFLDEDGIPRTARSYWTWIRLPSLFGTGGNSRGS